MPRRKIIFKSLRASIVATVITLVSLFSIIISIGNIGINTRRTVIQVKDSAKEVANQVVLNYESYLNSMFNALQYLEVELLNKSTSEEVLDKFSLIKNSRQDIENVILCNSDGSIKISTGLSLHLTSDSIEEDFNSSSEYSFSSPYMIDGVYKILIGKSIMYRYSGTLAYGILLIEFNFQNLVNISKTANIGEGGALYILDGNNNSIYSIQNDTSPLLRDKQLEYAKSLIIGTDLMIVGNKYYTIYSETLYNTSWKLVICSNVSPYFKNQTFFSLSLVVLALLSTGLAVLFASLISKRVTNPLLELEKSMKKLEEGDFSVVSVIDESRSQREIVKLNDNFNVMISQIRKLMAEVVAEQEAQRKSELKALQNQINPHFLYNTLDSIVFMAESNQVQEVKTMVVALAKFFRISISKGKAIITVREELEHAKNYMIIESIRYKDTFTFKIDCADDCLDLSAMKLMLQPFVENSIYHGLKNLEDDGYIHIKVYKDEEYVYFVVEDNGYGMRPSKIDELYRRMKDANVQESVGIKNVYQRLKLYYGEKSEVFIESELDEYTRFTIRIPIERNVE